MRQGLKLLIALLILCSPAAAQTQISTNIADDGNLKVVYADFPAKDAEAGGSIHAAIITLQVVNQYQCVPNPGNPPVGSIRVYCDSSTGNLTCINSSGGNCGGGGGSGFVFGNGTVPDLPVWVNSTTLGNSAWQDNLTTTTYAGTGGVSTAGVTYTGTPPFSETAVEGASASCLPVTLGQDALCSIADLSPAGLWYSANGAAYVPLAPQGAPAGPVANNQLIAGGGVVWTGLLHFTASAARYAIASVNYTSPQTNVTLGAADNTNPRIDSIIVDNTGTVSVVPGTAAGSPVPPVLNQTSQVLLTNVTVAANATTPTLTSTLVYDENTGTPTEWNCTASANFNCASTSNPFHSTHDIEATTAAVSNNVSLAYSTTVNLNTYQTFSFNIRNKAVWAAANSLSICFLNSTTVVGSCVGLRDGVYGFNQSNVSSYQQIAIPTAAFEVNTSSPVVDTVRFQVTGTTGTIGFYLDLIQLQSALPGNANGGVPGGDPGTVQWNNYGLLAGASHWTFNIAGTNLTAATGANLILPIVGPQCLHADSSGVVSGTGSDCGSGGGGGAWSGLTLSGTNTGTGMVLAPALGSSVPFTINAPSGQSVDIFDLNLNSVKQFWIDSTGNMNFLGTTLNVGSSTSTTAGVIAAHGGNTSALPGCFQSYNNADTINVNLCATSLNARMMMLNGPATTEIVQDFVELPPTINAQTGASYTINSVIVSGPIDYGLIVTRTHATAMSDTIGEAGGGTSGIDELDFGNGWHTIVQVLPGSVGSDTITTTTSNFIGCDSSPAHTVVVSPGNSINLVSDGADWRCTRLAGIGGGAPTGAAGGDLAGTYPNPTIGTTVFAPNSNIKYVSPNCGTQANCYAVKGDVRVTADCATTNGNATVTSATAAFTGADVGKKLFCINPTTGAAVNRGTVSVVGSSTSITSSANSTATTTGATLEVGTDDSAAFHSAYAAAITANQGISIPCGVYLLDGNAPVFDEGSTGNPSQNYSISGCSDSGNTNATTFILGPDLLDTAGDLVVKMPIAASGATFPLYNHGSSFGVSNLQIIGLSYKSAAAFNVIDALRGYNLRIYDMNSTSACYAIAALGAYGGEVYFDRLNIQINNNGLQTNTCGGVYVASGTSDGTAQGNNVISNSIFAFLSYKGVYFDAGGGSVALGVFPLLLLNDYMYQVGSSTANMVAAINQGQVNIQGGEYWPTSTTAGMFISDGSANEGYNISNALIYANSRPVFGPDGGFIKMRDTVIKGISASTFFQSTNITTSHFYNLGGNSLSALPTTNIPVYVNTSSETQTVTCSSSAATVTSAGTYLANPLFTVYDKTTSGLVTVTSQNLTTLVLGCPGASDVLTVTLTPNGF